MNNSCPSLDTLLRLPESENVEFKEAKNGYDKDKLFGYCVVLSNEGGGCFVLGVSDRMPRMVVGTRAFGDLDGVRNAIFDALKFDVCVREERTAQGRVVVFDVPGRPPGVPRQYKGAYLCRRGSSLVPMSAERLSAIFNETVRDYSAQICPDAVFGDLSPEAVSVFRRLWADNRGDDALLRVSDEQLLEDAELLVDGAVTNAALVLFGKRKSLSRRFPDAEVIFEYRSSEANIDHQQRLSFREGLFLFLEKLWETVKLRVETRQFQVGLVRREIPAFREEVFREGLLNAICHRDYRRPESVFVRQYPQRIDIESPGGLAPGLTPDNLMFKRAWPNRLIAEALQKANLVERSGQGVDRMWRSTVSDGKMPPDYSRTDEHNVVLTLHGTIVDEGLLRFLEEVGEANSSQFGTYDIAALHYISTEKKLPDDYLETARRLVSLGVIERLGNKYILARKYYDMRGESGVHTRKVGLDRETNLELVLKHIRKSRKVGCTLSDLQLVLPAQHPKYIQGLMTTLKQRGVIAVKGRTRGARWFPVEGLKNGNQR